MEYLLGIDLGTNALKGLLLSSDGEVIAISGKEYSLKYPKPDWCTIDANLYIDAAITVIKDLIAKSGVQSGSIKGISFSSQAETLIPVDINGNPLCDAIVWLDNRSKEEANEIEKDFGREKINNYTGQPEILPLWPASRLKWLKKNEPEIFNKTHKFLLVEDFIIHRMCGKYATEYSLSSSTLYIDINKRKWWDEMLNYLDVSVDQFPELYSSGEIIGTLLPEFVSQTGLSENTKIIAGAYDHASGAIGAGNISQGIVTETTGTSMAMCVTLDERIDNFQMNLPCQIHAVPGKYFLLPYGQTAGMVLRWFRDEFAQQEVQDAEKNGKDVYDILCQQAEKISPGSEGLLMLPHLAGSGSPEFNPDAQGVFSGIKLGMGKGHFVRAIMESIVFMIYRNLCSLSGSNISFKSIACLGGASKSDLWNQIKADMFKIPVTTLECDETPALGAAMLAGVGTGVFKDLEVAVTKSVKPKSVFQPNQDNFDVYQEVFKKYENLSDLFTSYWASEK